MVEITLSKHYLKNLSTYLRHDDFIDGSFDAVHKYLIQHVSESTEMGKKAWEVRLKRLANENLCEPILLQWEAFLTQEVTKADSLDAEPFSPILADIDGLGTPLESFVRQTHRQYLGFGHKGILVEGVESTSESLQEARERNERSYAMHYEPWHILKAERFLGNGPKRGKLCEVVLLERTITDEAGDYMIVRRLWIENQGQNYKSQLLKVKGNILKDCSGLTGSLSSHNQWSGVLEAEPEEEEKLGSFDEIPFVVIGRSPREDSVLYSVVPRNAEHLNKKSVKDSIDYYQAHQRVAFFGVRPEEISQWGENIVAFFENEQGSMTTVPSGEPTSLTDDLDKIERNAYMDGLLRVALRHQKATGQVQAANSKREDNATFENYLGYVTDIIEDALNQIMRYLWRFEKGSYPTEGEYELTLGRDFRIAFTEEELAERAILNSWLVPYGQAGRKAQATLAITSYLEQRIVALDDKTEDELKQEIVEELWAEAQKPEALSLRDRVRKEEGGLVNPQGSLDVTAAIEEGSASAETAE